MKSVITVLMVSFLCLAGLKARADNSEAANLLLVEAVLLVQSISENDNAEQMLEKVATASDKLNEIVQKYPSSDLAVKLITGQSVGNISLAMVTEALVAIKAQIAKEVKAAEGDLCYEKPTSDCLWVLALSDAKKIENAVTRYKALIALATAQANAGDLREARATILTAFALSQADKRNILRDTSAELREIAALQANAGDIKAASATAETIEEFYHRPIAYSSIATAQANAGDLTEARATIAKALNSAETIEHPGDRSSALSAIAEAQANAGDLTEARATIAKAVIASQLTTQTDNIFLMDRVEAQAKAGDFKAALATAEMIENNAALRAHALFSISGYQLLARDREGHDATEAIRDAITDAEKSKSKIYYNSDEKYSALRDLAKAQSSVGDTEAALLTLTQALISAKEIDFHSDELTVIATAQVRAGDIKAALATAEISESVSYRYNEDNVLSAIATAQANTGDIKAAFITVEMIERVFYRESALSAIATAQANTGDIKAASATVETIEEFYHRPSAYSSIATAQANAGYIEEARTTIKQALRWIKYFQYDSDRSKALSNIGLSLSNIEKK